MNQQKGKALKYGDNINTDIISPPQYMELDLEEASAYAMSGVDLEFPGKVQKGDIFVAENNLGSGSSRETSPLMLKYLGISAVVAKSFARIFYRNLINVGIPAIVCQLADQVCEGDELEIHMADGIIYNLTQNTEYVCETLPGHIEQIIEAGGLFDYLKNKQEDCV